MPHASKRTNPPLPCACNCGGMVEQKPGAGHRRLYLEGHQPSARKPAVAGACACNCGMQVIRLRPGGRMPRYFPGHSPSDRKRPYSARKR